VTHYLFYVGGNGSGKSNNLIKIHHTAYRNVMSTDVTAANIFQFLGSGEDEGLGTMCEDEADNIDQNTEKMRIYKNRYTKGFPVLRTDTSFGRRQLKLNTFCFKAFAAERRPDPEEARGFNQRIIDLECFPGNPPFDISDVVNPAGDQENQELLDELVEFKNTLLIYRMLHFHEPIPDIKDLNIRNREKQLFKPLIRLFRNEPCLDEILQVISEYISKKRAARVDSLHAYLYRTMKILIANKKTMEFESKNIWDFIKNDLKGSEIKGKPMSYDTDEFGVLSQNAVVSILKDVFGAEPPRHRGSANKLIFNKDKLDRLENIYNLELEIKVSGSGRGRGGWGGSGGSGVNVGLDGYNGNNSTNNEDVGDDVEHPEDYSGIKTDENENVGDDGDIVEDYNTTKADYDNTTTKESIKKDQESEESSNNHKQTTKDTIDEINDNVDITLNNPPKHPQHPQPSEASSFVIEESNSIIHEGMKAPNPLGKHPSTENNISQQKDTITTRVVHCQHVSVPKTDN
jgi:hypothetical protein